MQLHHLSEPHLRIALKARTPVRSSSRHPRRHNHAQMDRVLSVGLGRDAVRKGITRSLHQGPFFS